MSHMGFYIGPLRNAEGTRPVRDGFGRVVGQTQTTVNRTPRRFLPGSTTEVVVVGSVLVPASGRGRKRVPAHFEPVTSRDTGGRTGAGGAYSAVKSEVRQTAKLRKTQNT